MGKRAYIFWGVFAGLALTSIMFVQYSWIMVERNLIHPTIVMALLWATASAISFMWVFITSASLISNYLTTFHKSKGDESE